MSAPAPEGSSTTPLEIAMLGLRKWYLLCLGALVGGALGVVVSRMLSPKYAATAMVQIDTQARRPTGALGDMAELFQSDARAETETELIRSRAVAGEVVDSLGLRYSASSEGFVRRLAGKAGRMDVANLNLPQRGPKSRNWTAVVLDNSTVLVRDTNEQPVLKAKLGSLAQLIVGRDTVRLRFDSLSGSPGEVFTLRKSSRSEAETKLLNALKVAERGKRTGILQLDLTWGAPDRVMKILNAVASIYVKQNIETRSAEAHKSLEFLQQQMPAVRHRLDSLEDLLKNFRHDRGSVDIGSEARSALQGQADLQQQVLSLEQRRQELLRLYKEDHPAITAVDAQIKRVQEALSGSSIQVKRLPLTQQAIAKLSRDLDVETALYTALLNNIQQLQLVNGGEVGTARIVDPAEFPASASGPSRKLVIAVFILGGMFCVIGLLALMHSIDDGLKTVDDLEQRAGVQVLAQIPHSKTEARLRRKSKAPYILAKVDPADLAVEALRSLRIGLGISIGSGPKIVTVTGMSVDDGKTFVSSNLAVLLAQLGRKVLLVDGDLRRGRISTAFGAQEKPGLSEYLQGKAPSSAIIQTTEFPRLLVVPAGMPPSNPAELLASENFDNLIKSLAMACDVLLIDTPPLMMLSDPLFAMRQATQSLVVVSSGRHSKSSLQEGLRRIRQAGIPTPSFVLNNCDWSHQGIRYQIRYGKYETERQDGRSGTPSNP